MTCRASAQPEIAAPSRAAAAGPHAVERARKRYLIERMQHFETNIRGRSPSTRRASGPAELSVSKKGRAGMKTLDPVREQRRPGPRQVGTEPVSRQRPASDVGARPPVGGQSRRREGCWHQRVNKPIHITIITMAAEGRAARR